MMAFASFSRGCFPSSFIISAASTKLVDILCFLMSCESIPIFVSLFFGHCPLYRISVASLCIVDLSPFSCRRASFAVGFHGPWFFKQCFFSWCAIFFRQPIFSWYFSCIFYWCGVFLWCAISSLSPSATRQVLKTLHATTTLKTRIWIIIFFF